MAGILGEGPMTLPSLPSSVNHSVILTVDITILVWLHSISCYGYQATVISVSRWQSCYA